jgi:hypothetical protein
MKAFAHLVIDGPAVVRWSKDDDTGVVRITIDGMPHEHVVVEVRNIDRLIMEK